jgi:two-component system nitrogen regulation sensor histidine kinase NtrY
MKHLKSFIARNLFLMLTLAAIISAAVTYFVIVGQSAPLGLKPKRVLTLLTINAAILGVLILFIGARVYGLWTSLRAGSVGSKLQTRVILLFSIVTIFPTLVVSIFATLFFNIGVETWFNDRVQTAVEESLAVAQAYLNEHKENVRGDAIAMAEDLNAASSLVFSNPVEFNRIVAAQANLRLLTEAVVIYRNRIIAQGKLSFAIAFESISPDTLEKLNRGEVVIDTDDDDKIRASIKMAALPDAYLIIGRLVDSKVLTHMDATQGAVTEYRALKGQLGSLQLAFSVVIVSLALVLLLTAIWYGMVFASRLTTPISSLMQVAERVRGGDYGARVTNEIGSDEMGNLARTFNRMTEQLESQRGELILANRQLDERRRFSEAVLSGVSAGVIALNAEKQITLMNRSSASILGKIDLVASPERPLNELLPGIGELLAQAETLQGEVAQSSLSLSNNEKNLTLHVRVTAEKKDGKLEGFIVTFDDITLLVSAQRNAAWADVARRVAHEIKNPLTPIQLSAERLKKKYSKFITEDAENYTRYLDTITKHVGDIGKMVEEFVGFARMPTARFVTEDLTSIVRKSVFSSQVGFPNIDVVVKLPDAPILFECDERQITQVLTNIIKNAAESIESRPEASPKGEIVVELACEGKRVILSVKDNGIGFSGDDASKMLEPYVTTRSKGTGLGLAIVKKIVDDHNGLLFIENNSDCGAKVTLSFLHHCDINAS